MHSIHMGIPMSVTARRRDGRAAVRRCTDPPKQLTMVSLDAPRIAKTQHPLPPLPLVPPAHPVDLVTQQLLAGARAPQWPVAVVAVRPV